MPQEYAHPWQTAQFCCKRYKYSHKGLIRKHYAVQVVSRDIRTLLTSITNLTFSREYTGAVEAKQVAQQESERAKFIVSLFCHCSPGPLSSAHDNSVDPEEL